MSWFSRTVAVDGSDSASIEDALRKATQRRHVSLDLQSSVSRFPTLKTFYGIENTRAMKLTRIRSYLETIFPKFILRFDKEQGFFSYRIRLAFSSFLIFVILVFATMYNLFYSLTHLRIASDFPTVVLLLIAFIALGYIEYKIVKKKIDKVTHLSKSWDFQK